MGGGVYMCVNHSNKIVVVVCCNNCYQHLCNAVSQISEHL